jgi:hypothetical protein
MSELLRPLALPFPLFLSCLPPPLAVRCPVVGPTPLAVAPRAAPSTAPAFLSLFIYINSFLGSHGQLWVCPIQEVLYQIWDSNFSPWELARPCHLLDY